MRNNQVLCKSLPFVPEYFTNEKKEAETFLEPIFSRISWCVSEEASTIRVWYDPEGQNWNVSSHRRINADKSYWSNDGVSHGEQWNNAIEQIEENFYESLNKDISYVFYLLPTKNSRIVCPAPEKPTIYWVAEFERKIDFSINEPWKSLPNSTNLPGLKQVEIKSINYALELAETLQPGLIGFYTDDDGVFRAVKLTSTIYKNLYDLRGNTADLELRWAQLYNQSEEIKLAFMKLYPEMSVRFLELHTRLEQVKYEIYEGYLNRFIRKDENGRRFYVELPQKQWFVVKDLHDMYCKDANKYRISKALIDTKLKNLNPIHLIGLIRESDFLLLWK
jgi:hypothetical protein